MRVFTLMDSQLQQQLHDLIVETITESFQYIKGLICDERLYGFALHLNKDGRSFYCAANTLDGVTKKFTVKLRSIEDVTDYLWFSSEWDYTDLALKEYREKLNNVVKQSNLARPIANIWHDEYFKVIMEALQTCNNQGLFGIGILREKMAVFIDSEESNMFDVAERSSKLLNPPYVHDAFLRRFEPHDPQGLTYRLIGELVADY